MEENEQIPFKDYFPTLSLNAYFWFIIVFCGVFFGFMGYFVGVRISELPQAFSSMPQQVTTPPPAIPTLSAANIPGDDNDVDYSAVNGTFITNTSYYDQFSVTIDSLLNGVETNLDTDNRIVTKPQAGVQYPYSFGRLNPYKTYIISASACRTNPTTYALECAQNLTITKCSGVLQDNACIIKGNGNEIKSSGEVDFAIK